MFLSFYNIFFTIEKIYIEKIYIEKIYIEKNFSIQFVSEIWIRLSKSFQPEDKSPGVETLKLTSPISTAIVYKHQFCLHYCCAIILYPRDKEINTLNK